MKCHCKTPKLWKGPTAAVFSHLVTLDYYDGTVTALGDCAVCQRPNLISIVAGEPSATALRIFGVSPVTQPERSWIEQRLATRLKAVGSGCSSFSDGYDEALVELVLGREVAIVMAARSLEKEILTARACKNRRLVFREAWLCVSRHELSAWQRLLGLRDPMDS
jgi:hypothetical protein